MLVKSMLKVNGCSLIDIIDRQDGLSIAKIDYSIFTNNEFYGTMVEVPETVLKRKIDFVTIGNMRDGHDQYTQCLKIYVK